MDDALLELLEKLAGAAGEASRLPSSDVPPAKAEALTGETPAKTGGTPAPLPASQSETNADKFLGSLARCVFAGRKAAA